MAGNSPYLMDFLLKGMGTSQPRRTTSGIMPPTIDSSPFSVYAEDPSTQAYKRLNSVATAIANARAYSDSAYAAKKEKARQDAIARQQAAIHNAPIYTGAGNLGGNNLNPSLPKPKGNGYNLPLLTPPVMPGYTDSQFGAIAGSNQYIHPSTHITQAKPKPWYQKLWPPWGPLQ